METIKIGILGFGTVGQGIYHIINEKRQLFQQKFGVNLEVGKILVTNVENERVKGTKHLLTNKIEDVLNTPNLQVVFEAIVNEEPAFSYLKAAIEHKCHVVTANKVMFAKHGQTLQQLAEQYNVGVGYEASVAGGIPVIKTLKNLLLANEVNSIEGILNGTTNYILTKMRNEHSSFEEALQCAQSLGYAEADPYNDVSGQDAFKKLMILSSLSFGRQPKWEDVDVVGIEMITAEMVAKASKEGKRYRHVASICKTESGELIGKVTPILVDATHPLFQVEDVNNAVSITSDYIGTITLVGPGAGMYPTASVMVEDYLEIIVRKRRYELVN